MARIYEPSPDNVPFSFSVDLLIDGGAHASSSAAENLGSIDFEIACIGSTCDIEINQLRLPHMLYTGTFYDSSNTPSPFVVDGIFVHLMKPARGSVTSSLVSPPVVSFPSQDFEIWMSAGDISVDNVTLFTIGASEISVDQVVGTYSSGILTLNIAYETPDATLSVTLTTG